MEAPRLIAGLRRAGIERLAAAGVASPGHDAARMLAAALGTEPLRLPLVLDVRQEQVDDYEQMIRRRVNREPLQHILGYADFYGLRLLVGDGVFVPRSESELLVDWVARDAASGTDSGPGPKTILDLCAGSGALGLALATTLTDVEFVLLVESDPRAATWAERNLAAAGVPGRVSVQDVLDPQQRGFSTLPGQFDLVVCNPPYVPIGAAVDEETANWDPAAALWAGPDGLEFITRLIPVLAEAVAPGGTVVLEHDDTHGESVPALMSQYAENGPCFTDVQEHADLAGRPRFVTARRVHSTTGHD